MGRVIFLLEEQSMQTLLEGLLPRLFPSVPFLCIPHEGKDDLEGSIRETLRNWGVPGDRFIIVPDNDNANCVAVKNRLRGFCHEGRRDDAVVRIVCQELEAWYLGDPDALAHAFGNERLRRIKFQARFRKPGCATQTFRRPQKTCAGIPEKLGSPAYGTAYDARGQLFT